jgi:hypothetical protein
MHFPQQTINKPKLTMKKFNLIKTDNHKPNGTKKTFAEILTTIQMNLCLSLAVLLFAVSAGCEGAKPKQRPQTNQTTQKSKEKKPETPKNIQPPPKKPEPPKEEVIVKAEVGATEKGNYGGEKTIMAPVLVPLGTYWRAQEMTAYNIKIPHAMQLYKANNDNKAPATHEEFMEEIIKKEAIKLPKLPEGHKYIYDPKDEQLKISKPAN